MALGSVQTVLTCQKTVGFNRNDEAQCGPFAEGQAYGVRRVSAYVIDPGQAAALEAAVGPFDYAYASGLWAFGFTTVVGLYVATHGIGHVLGMIRRG
jgi:hypothetical protein